MRKRKDKTRSKVTGEKRKEIHSKVTKTSVVKAYTQIDKNEIFWLKKVNQFKMVKKNLSLFFRVTYYILKGSLIHLLA